MQFNEWLARRNIPANHDRDRREIIRLLAEAYKLGKDHGYEAGSAHQRRSEEATRESMGDYEPPGVRF